MRGGSLRLFANGLGTVRDERAFQNKKWGIVMWTRLTAAAIAGLLLWPAAAAAENRIALVIGNSTYQTVTVLPNPANDARLFTDLLKEAQFEVISAPDLSQIDLRRALRSFSDIVAQKGPDTVALVYYAGHGLQVEGENYLVPVDANIKRESDVAIEAVRLADVMSALANTPSKTKLVILDACRNNPFSDINKITGRGLAIVDAPTGSVVSYSTAPGMEALDGRGDNSPFTAALVEIAREPNLPIEQAFKKVRLAVHKSTEGQQTPWESTSLTSDFSFFGAPPASGQKVASAAAAALAKGTADIVRTKPAGFWTKELQGKPAQDAFEVVIREDDPDAYEEFIKLYPAPPFGARVRGLLERRREMMTWYTAVTVNTPLAYQAFLDRYPNSDLAQTARRMRDRAQLRAQSANLTRGMPGTTPQNTGPQNPPVVPASLPGPACSCPIPVVPKRVEPAPKKQPPPIKTTRGRPPTDDDIFGPGRRGPPPVAVEPPISIGIGIGGFGRSRSRGPGYQKPHH